MLSTALIILPVFLIILAGYGSRKTGLLGEPASSELNRFVVWLALPCLMFDVVATTDWRAVWHPGFVAVSVVSSFAAFLMGLIVGKVRGLNLADMSVDGLNASYSNSAYIGFPLMFLLFGEASRPFVVIAAALTLMCLFAASVLLIEIAQHGGQRGHIVAARVGKSMLRNPIVMSPVAGFGWWWTGIPLPQSADVFVSLLGGAASPAALVAIGLFLAARPLREAVTNPFVQTLTAIKLVAHPAVTAFLALYIFQLPHEIALMAIVMAALPTGTGPFMVAEFYARDGRVTSGSILLSTTISVLTIAAVLTWLGPSTP
ncbi:AEC family transporter [Rhizorhapis sp. SPR117]|uniref:AEC family transporter n=1 Tax=Rhizorhapis sp. SPR117 TaxID=2912611 RepID=UPI001F40E7E8|nr:AEC family transporter [Rhizorhapis sp. SPR117]